MESGLQQVRRNFILLHIFNFAAVAFYGAIAYCCWNGVIPASTFSGSNILGLIPSIAVGIFIYTLIAATSGVFMAAGILNAATNAIADRKTKRETWAGRSYPLPLPCIVALSVKKLDAEKNVVTGSPQVIFAIANISELAMLFNTKPQAQADVEYEVLLDAKNKPLLMCSKERTYLVLAKPLSIGTAIGRV